MPGQEPSGHLDMHSDYLPYGASGGGGQGGTYLFANLAELDRLIAKWEAVLTRILQTGGNIQMAAEWVLPPADDDPSVRQAKALTSSLDAAAEHNKRMFEYASGYIDKLNFTRAQYAADDQAAVDHLRDADGA